MKEGIQTGLALFSTNIVACKQTFFVEAISLCMSIDKYNRSIVKPFKSDSCAVLANYVGAISSISDL